MKFALFYEIPVPRPVGARQRARRLPQHARAGDRRRPLRLGRLLDGRAPLPAGVLALLEPRGALRRHRRRARERIRLGYGVRLMPKPYNHPVRTAESVAVLDLISGGRVDLGTGRSATRAELEGFGIDPAESRAHVAGGDRARRRVLDQRRVRVLRRVLADAEATGAAQAVAEAAPAAVGRHDERRGPRARSATSASACARSPWACRRRRSSARSTSTARPWRAAPSRSAPSCTTRPRPSRWPSARPDRDKAIAEARESFEWYPKTGARQIATLTDWMAERNEELGTYSYAADMKKTDDDGHARPAQPRVPDRLQRLRARDTRRVPGGVPPATRRRASTCCSAWSTRTRSPTRSVMQTIELMGTEVIPAFRRLTHGALRALARVGTARPGHRRPTGDDVRPRDLDRAPVFYSYLDD